MIMIVMIIISSSTSSSSSSSSSSIIANYHYSEAVPDELRRFYLTAVGYHLSEATLGPMRC